MLEVFGVIRLEYNTFNNITMRLKFPLILQLSDAIILLQNIDTFFFFWWVHFTLVLLVLCKIRVILSVS